MSQNSLALDLLLAPPVVVLQPTLDVVPALLVKVWLVEDAKITESRHALDARLQLRIAIARVPEDEVAADVLAVIVI